MIQVYEGDGEQGAPRKRFYYLVMLYCDTNIKSNTHGAVTRVRQVCYAKRRMLDVIARFCEKANLTADSTLPIFERFGAVAMRADKADKLPVQDEMKFGESNEGVAKIAIARYER